MELEFHATPMADSNATIFRPIGTVRCPRTAIKDDFWGGVISTIELDSARFGPEALAGLDAFSHIEVLYHLHRIREDEAITDARHPRGNTAWPKVGIFAQRTKWRPNRLALSCCKLVKVEGLTITVEGLDAIDGTPVLDIKPVMREFLPRGEVKQPPWATELMRDYYKQAT